ncbi:lytic transglycosylase domain-containing protein [Yoonia sp. MH D7]
MADQLRVSKRIAGAALVVGLLESTAFAQGVPVIDGQTLAERLHGYLHLETDEDTQVEKATNRAEIRAFENQQIASLDRMITAFSSVSTYQTTFMGGDADMGGVQEVYGPLANPAGRFVFGDARENIEDLIIRGAQDTYGLPGVAAAGLSPLQWRCLMQALIWQESRFKVGARSPAAAYGLTQIIPGTAQDLGIYPEYYNDPYLQIVGGARYLATQLHTFDGNIIFALGAYNAGPGRIHEYGGVPPFAETQHYVQVIPAKYNSYLLTIGGVEAQGTIDPALYAASGASLLSSGSLHFAEYAMNNAQMALIRVRNLVVQIRNTTDPKEAYDLNTMMRAELILILSARIETEAARTQAEYAQNAAQLARQRGPLAFLDFTQPDL